MPFCPACGYELTNNAKFCYRCGAQVAPPSPTQTPPAYAAQASVPAAAAPAPGGSPSFEHYLATLQSRLHVTAEYSRTLNAYCFRNAQVSAASVISLTKYHYHFFLRSTPGTDPQEARSFAQACLEDVWALPHHNSLSLNTFAIPVLCMDRADPAAIQTLDQAVLKKTGFSFSCASVPAILTLADGQLHLPAHTPAYGAAAYHTVKKTVGDMLYLRL